MFRLSPPAIPFNTPCLLAVWVWPVFAPGQLSGWSGVFSTAWLQSLFFHSTCLSARVRDSRTRADKGVTMQQLQPDLFRHETLMDAIAEAVQALGGPKKVGSAMRPEKPADEAARWVRDCLNADRREHFTPEQMLWLIQQARQADCHVILGFMAKRSGYEEPKPVKPEDEKARLQREYIEAVRGLKALTARIEEVSATPGLRAA